RHLRSAADEDQLVDLALERPRCAAVEEDAGSAAVVLADAEHQRIAALDLEADPDLAVPELERRLSGVGGRRVVDDGALLELPGRGIPQEIQRAAVEERRPAFLLGLQEIR